MKGNVTRDPNQMMRLHLREPQPAGLLTVPRLCIVGALSMTIAACGGNSAAPTPAKRVVVSGTYSATAHFSHSINFSTTTAGQLSITVSWRNAANTLWVDVSSSCTSEQYVAGTCQFVYSDRNAVAAPQKTPSVNSFAAGTYVLIIDDRGPADETVTYEVDLTS